MRRQPGAPYTKRAESSRADKIPKAADVLANLEALLRWCSGGSHFEMPQCCYGIACVLASLGIEVVLRTNMRCEKRGGRVGCHGRGCEEASGIGYAMLKKDTRQEELWIRKVTGIMRW